VSILGPWVKWENYPWPEGRRKLDRPDTVFSTAANLMKLSRNDSSIQCRFVCMLYDDGLSIATVTSVQQERGWLCTGNSKGCGSKQLGPIQGTILVIASGKLQRTTTTIISAVTYIRSEYTSGALALLKAVWIECRILKNAYHNSYPKYAPT
jgi:hypothetical protein